MIARENEVQEKYQFNFSWINYIPIMVLLGIIPLIVRFNPIDLEPALVEILGSTQVVDFYTQYKAEMIYLFIGILGLILFFTFSFKKVKIDNYFKIYYISIIAFFVVSILSTLMSKYKNIAIWGMPERAEGMVTIGCYIIMLLYCTYIINDIKDIKYILIPLSTLVIILTVIGVFQYAGKDLLIETEWGKNLIVPEKYSAYRDTLQPQYEKGKVYATMFHYNYVGSFGAMMVPLFVTLTLFMKQTRHRIVFGILSICSMFLLFGSTSRAGLIGLGASVLVFVIIFSSCLVRKWKFILPIAISCIVIILGFNKLTDGTIFMRIPSLVNDVVALLNPSNSSFDYKLELPIQAIQHKNGEMFISTLKGTLVLSAKGTELEFKDEQGNEVVYDQENTMYTTEDTRFNEIAFQKQQDQNENRDDFGIFIGGKNEMYFRVENEVHLINSITLEDIELVEAPAIGFKDKLKLGSSRGYIWSRSLPMLKDTLLIGHGPDTYILEFPQNDMLAKWYAYDTASMVVTKPHNLYLQIAINQGGLALIAFFVLIGAYLVQSVQLYAWKKYYESREILGISIILAIVGYLGAGIFNDSEISVAPIFWILLGTGMAINYMIQKERYKQLQKRPNKVINLK